MWMWALWQNPLIHIPLVPAVKNLAHKKFKIPSHILCTFRWPLLFWLCTHCLLYFKLYIIMVIIYSLQWYRSPANEHRWASINPLVHFWLFFKFHISVALFSKFLFKIVISISKYQEAFIPNPPKNMSFLK